MSRVELVLISEKLANPYSIEWVRLESGERLPLLVCRSTGLPIEAPTYWIAIMGVGPLIQAMRA